MELKISNSKQLWMMLILASFASLRCGAAGTTTGRERTDHFTAGIEVILENDLPKDCSFKEYKLFIDERPALAFDSDNDEEGEKEQLILDEPTTKGDHLAKFWANVACTVQNAHNSEISTYTLEAESSHKWNALSMRTTTLRVKIAELENDADDSIVQLSATWRESKRTRWPGDGIPVG